MASAGAAGVLFMTSDSMAQTNDPVVATRNGKWRGARLANCYAFRGIRCARAARFQAPRPPEPWTSVRDALSPGASAPQTNANPPPGPPYVILD